MKKNWWCRMGSHEWGPHMTAQVDNEERDTTNACVRPGCDVRRRFSLREGRYVYDRLTSAGGKG